MPKTPYILKLPRDHEIFRRPMVFTTIDKFGNMIQEKIYKPDDTIICDGCNKLIEDDEILCLVFCEGYIHSAQCPECVKEYFPKYKQYTQEEIEK